MTGWQIILMSTLILRRKNRHKLAPYGYNSFELLRQRITEVDMRNIADLIKGLPLQKELEDMEEMKYLLPMP